MRRRFRRPDHSVPELNMASLPDLIFTVLFFFMIVTHMRQSNPLMPVNLPQGTALAQTQHKDALVYIYIGREAGSGEYMVQVNNIPVPEPQLEQALTAIRERMPADSRKHAMAVLRADRDTPMSLVKQLKTTLRKARITKITYVANEKKTEDLQ